MTTSWDELSDLIGLQTTKQRIYDSVFLDFCKSDVTDNKVIDIGCGTGDIAEIIQKHCSGIQAYDSSLEMAKAAAVKIGMENIFGLITDIPENQYDVAICSLVLCVIEKKELNQIMQVMKKSLIENGMAYIGICNTEEFNVKETSLQIRHLGPNQNYDKEHSYDKTIKEGNFRITEQHRPLFFYENLFEQYGFNIKSTEYSAPEEFNGKIYSDFIIYKLLKEPISPSNF